MESYDLNRFIKAQEGYYEQALYEIRNGRKESHWMWFVFPQHKALCRTATSKYYGINGIDEARAYIEHPILGKRLREITAVLLSLTENNPYKIMGDPVYLKLLSCMTLFAHATDDNCVFIDVINKLYQGLMDNKTLRLIKE